MKPGFLVCGGGVLFMNHVDPWVGPLVHLRRLGISSEKERVLPDRVLVAGMGGGNVSFPFGDLAGPAHILFIFRLFLFPSPVVPTFCLLSF